MLQLKPFWNSTTGSASPTAGAKTVKLVSVPRNGGEENAITSAEDIGVYMSAYTPEYFEKPYSKY